MLTEIIEAITKNGYEQTLPVDGEFCQTCDLMTCMCCPFVKSESEVAE